MVSLTVITKLGKKLYFKERVIAAAIVLFRRKDNNLPKNSCCAADPFILIAACCYVAGKAEESPSPAENAVAGAYLCSVPHAYGAMTKRGLSGIPGGVELEIPDDAAQLAGTIINDTHQSDFCLLYPPHLLAITALYVALVLHAPTREQIEQKHI
ncbi:hypothetical protein SCLCIDRAFT_32283 [Scleroderma citrinum Foug A]|uniref:Cyclin C-terminal domain-containing protein n=1 Tax=Scleroderma citrinum Foug A TaxID=1036808 RepID=A0A0C2YTF4_9AGAM|nr:hypothetical protein SCLCIDRAFT_32283 [Scleroderma citrinum Foug A]